MKRSCSFKASQDKSAPCLVWCPWFFCKWRYNVFNLSCDLTWPPLWWFMQIYGWEFTQYVTTLINLVTIGVMIALICFKFVSWPLLTTCLKGDVNLWVVTLDDKSPHCHVWWPLVSYNWRYKVFNLSCDFPKPHDKTKTMWLKSQVSISIRTPASKSRPSHVLWP